MFEDNVNRYIFLRPDANKKTSHDGCICACYTRDSNTIKMSFSFCQPIDLSLPKADRTGDHFSRKNAHTRLIKRLNADPIITTLQDKDGRDDYRIEFDHSGAVNLAKHTILKWYEGGSEIHEGVRIPNWVGRWVRNDLKGAK